MQGIPLPEDQIRREAATLSDYANDEAAQGSRPGAVVFPKATAEVAAVLHWANDQRIPVVPRGAGTGLSGAAIPTRPNTLILSLEKMNQRLEVDPRQRLAYADPGVITGDLRRQAEKLGLLYAPIPASVDSCTLGGNVATNAGGLCAVKYGVTREHVAALEAVLPTGEIINTGRALRKDSTGYNLTQLLCGSEGTLAVITGITVRLLTLPKARRTMLVPFPDTRSVARGVVTLLESGPIPPTLEFIPQAALQCVRQRHPDLNVPFAEEPASVLIEMDGHSEDSVLEDLATVAEILAAAGAGEPRVASTDAQREELWQVRKLIRDSIANTAPYVEADTVVPRHALPELLEATEVAGRDSGLRVISYGHAGDGNLHTYFLRGEQDDAEWASAGDRALRGLFERTIELGGTLSGEHGIGSLKNSYMPLAFDPAQLALMSRLKAAFDPNGILNPDKVLPLGQPS